MTYNSEIADKFWSRRVKESDPLAAVLNYGVPNSVNEAYSDWEIGCLEKILPVNRQLNVLDLPSGNGRITSILAKKYQHVTAVDNSEGMLEACKRRIQDENPEAVVDFEHASATNLPFADSQFDLSLFLGLLEHLPEEPRKLALDELVRVTRPGGVIIFTVNNSTSYLLKQNPVYQRTEQYQEGVLQGFYNGVVGKEWLFEELAVRGVSAEISAANTLQSFATHFLRATDKNVWHENAWKILFRAACDLDVTIPLCTNFDELFADVFIVKAIKR